MKTGWMAISIDKLYSAPWNYKISDGEEVEKMMEVLKNNLKKYGQVVNIIVRYQGPDKFEVINGNHRLEAARQLGMDELYCHNLGVVPLMKAKKIAITTNEINFEPDPFKLGEVFKELDGDLDKLINEMPFTKDHMASMVNLVADNFTLDQGKDDDKLFDPATPTKSPDEEPNAGMHQDGDNAAEQEAKQQDIEIVCPHCHTAFKPFGEESESLE